MERRLAGHTRGSEAAPRHLDSGPETELKSAPVGEPRTLGADWRAKTSRAHGRKGAQQTDDGVSCTANAEEERQQRRLRRHLPAQRATPGPTRSGRKRDADDDDARRTDDPTGPVLECSALARAGGRKRGGAPTRGGKGPHFPRPAPRTSAGAPHDVHTEPDDASAAQRYDDDSPSADAGAMAADPRMAPPPDLERLSASRPSWRRSPRARHRPAGASRSSLTTRSRRERS